MFNASDDTSSEPGHKLVLCLDAFKLDASVTWQDGGCIEFPAPQCDMPCSIDAQHVCSPEGENVERGTSGFARRGGGVLRCWPGRCLVFCRPPPLAANSNTMHSLLRAQTGSGKSAGPVAHGNISQRPLHVSIRLCTHAHTHAHTQI